MRSSITASTWRRYRRATSHRSPTPSIASSGGAKARRPARCTAKTSTPSTTPSRRRGPRRASSCHSFCRPAATPISAGQSSRKCWTELSRGDTSMLKSMTQTGAAAMASTSQDPRPSRGQERAFPRSLLRRLRTAERLQRAAADGQRNGSRSDALHLEVLGRLSHRARIARRAGLRRVAVAGDQSAAQAYLWARTRT